MLARLRARLDASLHLPVHPRLLRRRLLRRWRLFPGRIAAARTAELLAAFADAPVRMAGESELLTPERLRARFAAGRRGSRNFAVEIGD